MENPIELSSEESKNSVQKSHISEQSNSSKSNHRSQIVQDQ